jgi:hypothetical protein
MGLPGGQLGRISPTPHSSGVQLNREAYKLIQNIQNAGDFDIPRAHWMKDNEGCRTTERSLQNYFQLGRHE